MNTTTNLILIFFHSFRTNTVTLPPIFKEEATSPILPVVELFHPVEKTRTQVRSNYYKTTINFDLNTTNTIQVSSTIIE